MTVLVMGGTRFIGAELVGLLRDAGHDVTVIALEPPPQATRHLQFIQADRNDAPELARQLQGRRFDLVFDNIAFDAPHVQGLLRALDGRFGRYVLTSSVDIYPMGPPQQWREEDALLEPSSTEGAPAAERYLRGKRACENALRASGVPYAIVRPAMVTGVGDPVPPRPKHWPALGPACGRSMLLPSRLLDGGPVLLPQSDRRLFQLAWVQDVARALLAAASHPAALQRAFNVAGDELWTHESLLRALAQSCGIDVAVVRCTDAQLAEAGLSEYELPYGHSPRCSLASNEGLKGLGWQPTPPALWLPGLLEAARAPDRRPFLQMRARELSLGRRLLGLRHSDHAPPTVVRTAAPRPAAERHPGSIGVGTHRGLANRAADEEYLAALGLALSSGIDLIDTAINYRAMRSERVVGRAVRGHVASGRPRESVFVVSKGGYVPHDGADRRPAAAWIEEELVRPGLLSPVEATQRHTIRAGWIAESLRRSLANLDVGMLDAYLVHNPELARARLGSAFWPELTRTFAVLEDAVAQGHILSYGLALWRAARTPAQDVEGICLDTAIRCAEVAAAGGPHHFKVVEMPLNVMNLHALQTPTQLSGGRHGSLLSAARAHGLHVLTSASIAGGAELTERARLRLPSLDADADDRARALQFTRSVPGVGTALVGMRQPAHVRVALQVLRHPRTDPAEMQSLIARGALAPQPPRAVEA